MFISVFLLKGNANEYSNRIYNSTQGNFQEPYHNSWIFYIWNLLTLFQVELNRHKLWYLNLLRPDNFYSADRWILQRFCRLSSFITWLCITFKLNLLNSFWVNPPQKCLVLLNDVSSLKINKDISKDMYFLLYDNLFLHCF